jgi:hypothetical protein
MIALYVVLVLGNRFAEGYCLANDLEQSTGRYSKRSSVLSPQAPCSPATPTLRSGRSNSRQAVPRSPRSLPTMPALRAATQPSLFSTSYGHLRSLAEKINGLLGGNNHC